MKLYTTLFGFVACAALFIQAAVAESPFFGDGGGGGGGGGGK